MRSSGIRGLIVAGTVVLAFSAGHAQTASEAGKAASPGSGSKVEALPGSTEQPKASPDASAGKAAPPGSGSKVEQLPGSTGGNTAPSGGSDTPARSPGSQGVTSGPAAETPTTLGSGGTTGGSPHQLQAVGGQSSSVTREAEQTMGSGAGQSPHGPAAGVKGAEGSESGPAAGETAEQARQ
jgi:hypothetical protein